MTREEKLKRLTNNRVLLNRIVSEICKREMKNLGRWCEVEMKKSGKIIQIVRTGYGPMEYPERDSHEIQIDGEVVAKCDDLMGVAIWMLNNTY